MPSSVFKVSLLSRDHLVIGSEAPAVRSGVSKRDTIHPSLTHWWMARHFVCSSLPQHSNLARLSQTFMLRMVNRAIIGGTTSRSRFFLPLMLTTRTAAAVPEALSTPAAPTTFRVTRRFFSAVPASAQQQQQSHLLEWRIQNFLQQQQQNQNERREKDLGKSMQVLQVRYRGRPAVSFSHYRNRFWITHEVKLLYFSFLFKFTE